MIRQLTVIAMLALTGCVDYADQLGLTQAQWQQLSPSEKRARVAEYRALESAKQASVLPGEPMRPIRVTLKAARASFQPDGRVLPVRPVTWTVHAGQCRRVMLKALIEPYRSELGSCYQHGLLSLDPSRYPGVWHDGSVHLLHSQLWHLGYTYQPLHSHGYAKLEAASIRVVER